MEPAPERALTAATATVTDEGGSGSEDESEEEEDGWADVLIYVLSPEKYVLMATLGDEIGFVGSLVLILFDLAGAGAFVTAIFPEEPFPPALLVGYVVAALATFPHPLVPHNLPS